MNCYESRITNREYEHSVATLWTLWLSLFWPSEGHNSGNSEILDHIKRICTLSTGRHVYCNKMHVYYRIQPIFQDWLH